MFKRAEILPDIMEYALLPIVSLTSTKSSKFHAAVEEGLNLQIVHFYTDIQHRAKIQCKS